MYNNQLLKGVFLVGLGASSYGMLATFVRLAYNEGYTTAEVTTSQFVLGILGMLFLVFLQRKKNQHGRYMASAKDKLLLMTAGTSLGLTSVFYYLSVLFLPVSIAIVLLMQTVWMGVVIEIFFFKKYPDVKKIMAVLMVLIGTLMATNALASNFELDWRGIALGLLSATSFTTTMFTANHIAVHVSAAKRSLFMLLGGAVVVFTFAFFTLSEPFQWTIFYKWGILLALFGTIIPPILMNKGFPITGISIGSIVSALELPVSVSMAFLLLHEKVTLIQWQGIILILVAIILMNTSFSKSKQ